MTSNFAGPLDITETQKALNFKMDKLGLNVILKAPTWTAYVYNTQNKSMLEASYKDWTKKFLMSHASRNDTGQKTVREITKETKTIDGIKTHKIIVKRERFKKDELVTVAELWVAPEIKCPPQFFSMMRALGIKIEDEGGAPLQVTSMSFNAARKSHPVPMLECKQVEKKMIPASTFATLSGYKKVPDEMALMMGDDTDNTDGLLKSDDKPALVPSSKSEKIEPKTGIKK